jgi:hypothetical protein
MRVCLAVGCVKKVPACSVEGLRTCASRSIPIKRWASSARTTVPNLVMLKEGAVISKSHLWLIRVMGMTLFIYFIVQLFHALNSGHFELGASRRFLEFDIRHGKANFVAGIVLILSASALGIVLGLLEVFRSTRGRKLYSIAAKCIGGISMAAIAFGYLVQSQRF